VISSIRKSGRETESRNPVRPPVTNALTFVPNVTLVFSGSAGNVEELTAGMVISPLLHVHMFVATSSTSRSFP